MTLTKFHLIDAIAKQNGFPRKKSTETVEDPTLSELEMDFKEVCNIRGEFV